MNEHEVEIENVIDPTKAYHFVLDPKEMNIIYLPCGNMPRGKAEAYCQSVFEKWDLKYKVAIIPTFDN